jgi:hypothetical protein
MPGYLPGEEESRSAFRDGSRFHLRRGERRLDEFPVDMHDELLDAIASRSGLQPIPHLMQEEKRSLLARSRREGGDDLRNREERLRRGSGLIAQHELDRGRESGDLAIRLDRSDADGIHSVVDRFLGRDLDVALRFACLGANGIQRADDERLLPLVIQLDEVGRERGAIAEIGNAENRQEPGKMLLDGCEFGVGQGACRGLIRIGHGILFFLE